MEFNLFLQRRYCFLQVTVVYEIPEIRFGSRVLKKMSYLLAVQFMSIMDFCTHRVDSQSKLILALRDDILDVVLIFCEFLQRLFLSETQILAIIFESEDLEINGLQILIYYCRKVRINRVLQNCQALCQLKSDLFLNFIRNLFVYAVPKVFKLCFDILELILSFLSNRGCFLVHFDPDSLDQIFYLSEPFFILSFQSFDFPLDSLSQSRLMASAQRCLIISQVSQPFRPSIIMAQLINTTGDMPRRQLSLLALLIGLLSGRSILVQPLHLTIQVLHEALYNLDSLNDLILKYENTVLESLLSGNPSSTKQKLVSIKTTKLPC